MSSTALIPPGHIARLDGLRAVAVLLVLAVHGLVGIGTLSIGRLFTFGWTGVDLFFALSGFLITRILLQSREDAGYFKSFYARRALRIWPLYYVVLGLAFLLVPRLPQPELAFSTGQYPFWPCALLLQNYVFEGLGPWPLMVTWSLAVEEQYYLVWPLLVRLLRPRLLQGILLAVVVTQPLLRFILLETGTSPLDVYRWTHCRLDGLAMGGLVALWTSGATARPGPWLRRLSSLAAYGLLPALWLAYVILVGEEWPPKGLTEGHARAVAQAALYSLTALAHTGLLLQVLLGESPRLSRVLEHPFLQLVGKLSYCLYLAHLPVIRLVQVFLRPRLRGLGVPNVALSLLLIVLELGISLAVAMVSWRVLEKPILRLKDRFPSSPARRPAPSPAPAGASQS